MAIICIETQDVMQTTCMMEHQQAQFLYLLSTDDPHVFKLYFNL